MSFVEQRRSSSFDKSIFVERRRERRDARDHHGARPRPRPI
jgi:hypothetical protein